ncbi:hypothetical protein A3E06_00030 [Candidatus Giovannonibacteria bacterium RIFCSPHIGHO2_12_FULL_44_42]|nr:MAG: hypothetical protein A3E06_00030 [Candidatus Giovannonibacteria bacterium RIFCSPHIGHO2_12_FULL_44_42]
MAGKWESIGRPGYLGKHRDNKHFLWNQLYGEGNWRLAWNVGERFVDKAGAYVLYEEAYFQFFAKNMNYAYWLVKDAGEIYDDEVSNVDSGFDYGKQETTRTHLQDIAIRRCLLRLGMWFEGTELVRIRQEEGTNPLSVILSPGRVPFHKPELIVCLETVSWWYKGTIESWYQNNKYLQAKT